MKTRSEKKLPNEKKMPSDSDSGMVTIFLFTIKIKVYSKKKTMVIKKKKK
jgi:hypothetical protein